jgi:hypothetical protein
MMSSRDLQPDPSERELNDNQKNAYEIRCKKFELKQKGVELLMKGITITFTINLGLIVFWGDIVIKSSLFFFIVIGLNILGLFAFLIVGHETNQELLTIPPRDINMRPRILRFACSAGFVLLIGFWVFLSYKTDDYFQNKEEKKYVNPINITSSGHVTIKSTGQVAITSVNPVTTTTIRPVTTTAIGTGQ